MAPYEVFRVTDPSNERAGDDEARDASNDVPDDADVTEPDTDAVDDDATDPDSEPAADDDADDERPAKEKPVATGKASRSGNPARAAEADDDRRTRPVKPQRIGNRWAAPAMLTCAGIGLLWIVLYYVFANQENPIPVMADLGDWNLIIGMGFIVAAFGFSMKWE